MRQKLEGVDPDRLKDMAVQVLETSTGSGTKDLHIYLG